MKIASIGPQGVVEAQPESYDFVDFPEIESIAPSSEESPLGSGMESETSEQDLPEQDSPEQENSKFSRIHDLVLAAQKKGRLHCSIKDRKRVRAVQRYLAQKDSGNTEETKGTTINSSA